MLKFCSIFLNTDPRERIQALYDCFAPLYVLLHPFVGKIASRAVTLLEDGQQARALDVCTGTGVLAHALARCGYEVVGIDHSLPMLSQRRKVLRREGIRNIGMDARQLAFADKSFDLCTISMALHEFSPADRRQILAEMSRISRKYILIADYSGRQPFFINFAEWLEASHFKDFTDGSPGRELAELGLKVVRHEQWFSIGFHLCELPEGGDNPNLDQDDATHESTTRASD
jgi:ubiquinone/menaquinone biosynthesis C-methylase UbiE